MPPGVKDPFLDTESGEQLGFAYFRGCASLRHECGMWSRGRPERAGFRITLDPEGRFIDIEGSGPPPDLEPA